MADPEQPTPVHLQDLIKDMQVLEFREDENPNYWKDAMMHLIETETTSAIVTKIDNRKIRKQKIIIFEYSIEHTGDLLTHFEVQLQRGTLLNAKLEFPQRKNSQDLQFTTTENGKYIIDLDTIPVIALQYTEMKLVLTVKQTKPDHLPELVLQARYELLQTDLRRNIAQTRPMWTIQNKKYKIQNYVATPIE